MFQTLQCEIIGELFLYYRNLQPPIVPAEVEMDADGILSASMREILENWPEGKPKPKVLYTVPVCRTRRFRIISVMSWLYIVWMQPFWRYSVSCSST